MLSLCLALSAREFSHAAFLAEGTYQTASFLLSFWLLFHVALAAPYHLAGEADTTASAPCSGLLPTYAEQGHRAALQAIVCACACACACNFLWWLWLWL